MRRALGSKCLSIGGGREQALSHSATSHPPTPSLCLLTRAAQPDAHPPVGVAAVHQVPSALVAAPEACPGPTDRHDAAEGRLTRAPGEGLQRKGEKEGEIKPSCGEACTYVGPSSSPLF